MNNKTIEEQQRKLWKNKISIYDNSIKAIGSESMAHKNLHYKKISELFKDDSSFSLLDVGAGFGDYFDYLVLHHSEQNFSYHGLEIIEDFCKIAREKYPLININTDNILTRDIDHYDYVILSGIFHQRGDVSLTEWNKFLEQILIKSFTICRKGISFNILCDFVDYKIDGNYYVDLDELIKFIIVNISRYINVDISTPLFEATLQIYNPTYILNKYPQKEFSKYIKI